MAGTQASAPGKVLIAGGYLIVEAPNVGVSIGVNARFTSVVRQVMALADTEETTIHIDSPQFKQSYCFKCTTQDVSDNVHVTQVQGQTSPFLAYSVLCAVAAARVLKGKTTLDVSLEIYADNDFYSQRNYLESIGQPVCTASLRQLPPCLPLVGSVSKTGLGSSAAMTTSVVACLLATFLQSAAVDKEVVHRVAQIAHSVAQGKIGSGFDVFTAVYGTCAYRRFPAAIIENMVKGDTPTQSVSLSTLGRHLDVAQPWVNAETFHLPRGMCLVLGDVHQGGSGTPGMVAKIMQWRRRVAEVEGKDNLWEKLRRNNDAYVGALRTLNELAERDAAGYDAALHTLSQVCQVSQHVPNTAAEEAIHAAAALAALNRTYLREMGVAAGVKVEPSELTELLDDTASLPGVFAVGCPGAGGYDAIFALVLGADRCHAVEKFWESYGRMQICPLLVREDPSGLLVEAQKA